MFFIRIALLLAHKPSERGGLIEAIGIEPTRVVSHDDLDDSGDPSRMRSDHFLEYAIRREGEHHFGEVAAEFFAMISPCRLVLLERKDRFPAAIAVDVRCSSEGVRSSIPWIGFEADQVKFCAEIADRIDIAVS